MQINNTTSTASPNYGIAVLRLGFRPFFLMAGLFAIIAMALWMAIFQFALPLHLQGLPIKTWHAHEMLFGYTTAVIAGFLLTAIKNWTGQEVLRGKPLALLALLWLVARIIPLIPLNIPLWFSAIIDVSFLLFLALICLRPILKVKQYKQLGIIAKLFLLMLCHVLYYLGVAGELVQGINWGIYSAIYMIIALVLVMMRRVMPMFINNGVAGGAKLTNYAWIDKSSLLLLLLLWITDVFTSQQIIVSVLAIALAVLHSIRLAGWYTKKVWVKPLVWILIVAYLAIIIAFILTALTLYNPAFYILATHAFTVGGIGMITLGMMSRVSLGHTGRDVFTPPPIVKWSFILLLLSFLCRVIFPLFLNQFYSDWIYSSQILWILAFAIFIVSYTKMLLSPRVDGRDG